MLTLLKGFAIFVAATLGTTAIIGHAPRATHSHHSVQAFNGVTVDTSVALAGEQDLLRPRTPAYVPPAPEPAPAAAVEAPVDQAQAVAAPVSTALSAPRYNPPAATPLTQVSVGSAQQAMINADRAGAGLPPLSWSNCLSGIAAGQDGAMVAAGHIFHGSGVSQDFGCGLGSGQTGENVGYWSGGINDSQLNVMFMNSPDHRANIMGPYRYVGTAWRVAPNGFAYISVEFG